MLQALCERGVGHRWKRMGYELVLVKVGHGEHGVINTILSKRVCFKFSVIKRLYYEYAIKKLIESSSHMRPTGRQLAQS